MKVRWAMVGRIGSGAKAPLSLLAISARLKSCPDSFPRLDRVFRQAVNWCLLKSDPIEIPGLPPLPQKQERGKDGAPKFRGLGATVAAGVATLLIAVCAALPAEAKDAPRSFSLSTSRTFSPGESVKIQLFARNEPALEFRVYKVKDEEKFFAGLKSLHSFGETNAGPAEKIDERDVAGADSRLEGAFVVDDPALFQGAVQRRCARQLQGGPGEAGQAQHGSGRRVGVRPGAAAE
jgi:hypothetical protein